MNDRSACPHGRDDRLTARLAPPIDGPAFERDDDGVIVRGFAPARAVLRASGTRQAGFKAELMDRKPGDGRAPILFLEGKEHHEQRRRTAPFFTPKTVREKHRSLMEAEADRLVARVHRRGRGDLSNFGMEMATAVTARIVGLTEKSNAAMARRINAFFTDPLDDSGGRARQIWSALKAQSAR